MEHESQLQGYNVAEQQTPAKSILHAAPTTTGKWTLFTQHESQLQGYNVAEQQLTANSISHAIPTTTCK